MMEATESQPTDNQKEVPPTTQLAEEKKGKFRRGVG